MTEDRIPRDPSVLLTREAVLQEKLRMLDAGFVLDLLDHILLHLVEVVRVRQAHVERGHDRGNLHALVQVVGEVRVGAGDPVDVRRQHHELDVLRQLHEVARVGEGHQRREAVGPPRDRSRRLRPHPPGGIAQDLHVVDCVRVPVGADDGELDVVTLTVEELPGPLLRVVPLHGHLLPQHDGEVLALLKLRVGHAELALAAVVVVHVGDELANSARAPVEDTPVLRDVCLELGSEHAARSVPDRDVLKLRVGAHHLLEIHHDGLLLPPVRRGDREPDGRVPLRRLHERDVRVRRH
mmetsp:Transcript_3673/g.9897  ORF Transcript_3673/g.9897 Transcript_3673/m.9897 type:complete len:295 (-) Transcript_3673:1192-2076(-)